MKKDGTTAKVVVVPDLELLQNDPEWICEWVDYSTLDSQVTWHLRAELEQQLRSAVWQEEVRNYLF